MTLATEEQAKSATVAIITALTIEQAAAKAMLDDPQPYSTPGNAPGEYFVGTIPSKDQSEHVVVLARCDVGENLAASNTTLLLERFPNIREVLMVGIAGAVPNPDRAEDDVRLGDIVVTNTKGIIQYDLEKEVSRSGGVSRESRHPPRPPSARLTAASKDLELLAIEGRYPWQPLMERAAHLQNAPRPTSPDQLHDAKDPARIVARNQFPGRRDGVPSVFSGPIASGNKLIKNVRLRERLRASFGVKAVEMEASGVADASWLHCAGYFVVRGTCDYCDEFKNDDWQQYAAIAAAAYARALLMHTRAADGGTTSRIEPKGTSSDSRSHLSKSVQGSLAAAEASGEMVAMIEELASKEAAFEVIDPCWPAPLSRAAEAAAALSVLPSDFDLELRNGEAIVGAALPYLMGAIQKSLIQRHFGSEDETLMRRSFEQVFVTSPASELLRASGTDEASSGLLIRWGILRWLQEQRAMWPDDAIRSAAPDTPLSSSLAADSRVVSLMRVVAGNLDLFDILPEDDLIRLPGATFQVRWKLLACLVTLAEAKALSGHLIPPSVVQNAAHQPEIASSLGEQFSQMSIVNRSDGVWVVRGIFSEPLMDYAAREIAAQLGSELRTTRATMSDYFSKVTGSGFPTVRAAPEPALKDGEAVYTTPHVNFSLSAEHARRLFMGTDLWGNDALAFRELFQNALDACRYRAARARLLKLPYAPLIEIYHGIDQQGREFVECRDNGIGMNRGLIAKCFAKAGNRFVDTNEFQREKLAWEEEGIRVYPNSQFGIGVFSYFLVADAIEVETARLKESGTAYDQRLLLRIPTASSFFRVVNLSDDAARKAKLDRCSEQGLEPNGLLDAGTRIRLFLMNTRTDGEDLEPVATCLEAIRENVWLSEIRTHVRDHLGNSLVLEPNELAGWLTATRGTSTPALWWIQKGFEWLAGGDVATTFRSHTRTNPQGPKSYELSGRVLVDGIATDIRTPGFVVNLSGEQTPKLSLDRRNIRSDFRGILEEAVGESVAALPDGVHEETLSDLWKYDPRACHRANNALQGQNKRWARRSRRFETDLEIPRELTSHSYFPWKGPDSFSQKDTREEILSLWKLARTQPDSRTTEPLVLEARGVKSAYSSGLATVPAAIWESWSELDLGVPEAAVLEYGISKDSEAQTAAYVSWLCGIQLGQTYAHIETIYSLLGEEWSRPTLTEDAVLTDRDAWLLSRASLTPPWVGNPISTLNLMEFSTRSGWSLENSLTEYEALCQRTGWRLEAELDKAHAAAPLNRDEMMLAGAIGTSAIQYFAEDHERDRLEQIALLAGAEVPPLSDPAPRIPKSQDIFLRELRVALGSASEIGLEVVCSVAQTLDQPLGTVAAAIEEVAATHGLFCNWDTNALAAAEKLERDDWNFIQSPPSFLRTRRVVLAKPTVSSLAANLGDSTFRLAQEDRAVKVEERLVHLYNIFGWGAPPLTRDQIKKALSLSYAQVCLLRDHANSGELTFLQALVRSVKRNIPLHEVAENLTAIAFVGVRGPSPSDTYLGTRWIDVAEPPSDR